MVNLFTFAGTVYTIHMRRDSVHSKKIALAVGLMASSKGVYPIYFLSLFQFAR